jgi:hypothetical protein
MVAMIAEKGHVRDPDVGDMAANLFRQANPELAGIRLRFGIGCPVVCYMLVFAGDLATVAAVTN